MGEITIRQRQAESGYISAAFSKDGKLLALGGRRDIKLIDPDSREQIRDIELPEQKCALTSTGLLMEGPGR